MTPAKFTAALRKLGLNQRQAAEALHIKDEVTVWRMANGKGRKRGIPGPVAVALETMIALRAAQGKIKRLQKIVDGPPRPLHELLKIKRPQRVIDDRR